jgi:hypothetical protein
VQFLQDDEFGASLGEVFNALGQTAEVIFDVGNIMLLQKSDS